MLLLDNKTSDVISDRGGNSASLLRRGKETEKGNFTSLSELQRLWLTDTQTQCVGARGICKCWRNFHFKWSHRRKTSHILSGFCIFFISFNLYISLLFYALLCVFVVSFRFSSMLQSCRRRQLDEQRASIDLDLFIRPEAHKYINKCI